MSLEEQSFINLIEFYRSELTKIQHGKLATKVLTDCARMSLGRHGVFGRKHKGDTQGNPLVLSDRALKALALGGKP